MNDSAQTPTVKLVSLNIEMSKHLGTVLSFLEQQQPDIFCAQEIVERDINRFVTALGGAEYEFAPRLRHMEASGNPIVGVAVFSRLRVVRKDTAYYVGDDVQIPEVRPSAEGEKRGDMNCALVTMTVEKEGSLFTVGTTHFTWAPDGESNMAQRVNMNQLLDTLKLREEIVFTGDFNAPRGKDVFARLADSYADNVPAEYTSSIDGNLHRAGQLHLMVDGLFSTPQYKVSNVKMVCGLSDHCALTADISRN